MLKKIKRVSENEIEIHIVFNNFGIFFWEIKKSSIAGTVHQIKQDFLEN